MITFDLLSPRKEEESFFLARSYKLSVRVRMDRNDLEYDNIMQISGDKKWCC